MLGFYVGCIMELSSLKLDFGFLMTLINLTDFIADREWGKGTIDGATEGTTSRMWVEG